MTNDDFDKEITSLYQQRKQQVVAPEIDFSAERVTKKTRYSILQMLSILLFGGVTSFGILAVISHLSVKAPIKLAVPSVTKMSFVELEKSPVLSIDDTIIVPPPLIPKKPYVAPIKSTPEVAIKAAVVSKDLAVSLPTDVVNVVASVAIAQPELSLVPIYQEQPKYTIRAIRGHQSGTVTLAYNISSKGKVSDITIVKSNASRELNKSAKKALSKWLYQPGEFNNEKYSITFDFIFDEKNKFNKN